MLKILTTIIITLFIGGMLYGQSAASHLYYSDIIVIPSDSTSNVFYTYKIPLSHLVFEKGSDLFLAQYRISVEIFNTGNDKFIIRSTKEKNIQVPDYSQTISSDIYSEGVLVLNLKPGDYSVMEIFYDYKSAKENKFPLRIIHIDSVTKFEDPVIVSKELLSCNNKQSPVVTNYGGNLPFDENEYSFIFPVKTNNPDSLFLKVIQDKDTIFRGVMDKSFRSSFQPIECGGKILLDFNQDLKNFSIFKADGISKRIKEGSFLIRVSDKSDFSGSKDFKLNCKWINKPRSLRDPEIAINALKFIEKDSVINSLLDVDKEDYQTELDLYWKKIDPTPLTEFNPLMQEYYQRIDYASKNFTTIAGTNGADTDRGKIYIKFGKPSEIDRLSDDHGYIIETWTYNNSQRKFVFIDKKGTGDFSLISG